MARYHVRVRPQVWQEIKHLPGDVRQRVKRAVDELADEVCPSPSWEKPENAEAR